METFRAAPRRHVVVLSGRTPRQCQAAAERLLAHLTIGLDRSIEDVAFSLATASVAHEHRLTLVASSVEELRERLALAIRGQTQPSVVRSVARAHGKVTWLFTGHCGAKLRRHLRKAGVELGMGRELCAAWPVFGEALDAACQ